MNRLVFTSKIDGWLLVVLVGSALASLLASAVILISLAPGPRTLAGAIILIGAVLPIWLLVSTRYVLTSDLLEVRSGPFRWRIPIREICEIVPTRSPLSSPALSLDRLRIVYREKRWIMISPLERERFLRELALRREASTHAH